MKFSHLDDEGRARMVDVTGKPVTSRQATAVGAVLMKPETLRLLLDKSIAKGNVLGVARIAGILAAKKTPDLIPMCHPLNITSVTVDFDIDQEKGRVNIRSTVKVEGQTGVEMEALVAVSAAALTIYDMCKAVEKELIISDIMLLEKQGGKSGGFKRQVKHG